MTKLYVGNLPFTATEDSVRALFAPHGAVESLALITDRETGNPRGFGFVEVANADAARAMQALNGADFDGRPLRINEAQSKDRSNGGDRGGPRRF
jgi:RNA recognition motif-containing protein